jgi:hypothetical protein
LNIQENNKNFNKMLNAEQIKSVTKEAKELRTALLQMIKAGEQGNTEFTKLASKLSSLKEAVKTVPGKPAKDEKLNNPKYDLQQNDSGASVLNAFRQSLTLAEQINVFISGGASQVINAFRTAFTFVQGIVQLINTINLISSLLSFIPGGGAIAALARAGGGIVPGAGSRDTVHAVLTPGEFVMNKNTVNSYGEGFFAMLNGGSLNSSLFNKFASGGMVKNSQSGFNGTIIIQSEIEKTKAVKFLSRYYPEYLADSSLKGALAG